MNKLDKYVGRMVRLNEETFRRIKGTHRWRPIEENNFIVATVSHEMRKLICYGGNIRIAVGASDVRLI